MKNLNLKDLENLTADNNTCLGDQIIFDSETEYRTKIVKAGTVVFLAGAICGVGVAATINGTRGNRKIKK